MVLAFSSRYTSTDDQANGPNSVVDPYLPGDTPPIRVNGEQQYLWRAVDQDGDVFGYISSSRLYPFGN